MSRVLFMRASKLGAFVAGLVLHATAGGASAFLEPPGAGLVISELAFSTSSSYFDRQGHPLPVSSYRKFELSSYIEYGLAPGVALIAQPTAESIRTGGPRPAGYTGIGTTDLGVKFGLYQAPGLAFAVQSTIHAAPPNAGNPALFGNRDTQADLRVLAFKGARLYGLDMFLNAEAAYRTRGDGFANEVHVDLTFGARPWARVLLLAQVFNVIPVDASARYGVRSHKFQGSVVYEFTAGWSLAAGGFVTFAGVNTGRDMGPLVAVWYRF